MLVWTTVGTHRRFQEKLLMQSAIKPSSEVKVKLFKKIASTEERVSARSGYSKITFWRYAAAVLFIVAIITSYLYLAYNYWDKWKAILADFSEVVAQNQQLAQGSSQRSRSYRNLKPGRRTR